MNKFAESAYFSEFEHYCNSRDGRERQKRRRNEHMARVQEKINSASQAVDAQPHLIESLRKQLQE